MKKLNKLLISTLSLGTIAVSAIPLSSCNKNSHADGVKVTKEEWNNALAYLATAVEGASWKSSTDDLFELTTYNSENDSDTIRFNDLAFNNEYGVMNGSSTIEGKTQQQKMISIARGGLYFKYVNNGDLWDADFQEDSPIAQVVVLMVLAIGGQDSFTFDNNTKAYIYNGDYEYEGSDVHSDVTIRFNTDKKISYIKHNSTVTNKTTKAKEMISGLTLHPQYENVTVDVPAELITRANNHTLEMSSLTKTMTLPPSNEDEGIIIIASNCKYTKITAEDNASPGQIPDIDAICINGKHQKTGEDYTLDISESKIVATFTKQIEKSDVVSFDYDDYSKKATTLTITLS